MLGTSLISASLAHFRAQEAEALAVLEIYLNKASGVADHSGIVDEINKWCRTLTEARENITTLQNLIARSSDASTDTDTQERP